MTDTPFVQLSERWRLACDRHQWVVQRLQGTNDKKQGERWRSGPFISSTRTNLIRYLLEDGAVVDDWRVVLMLPNTFREWQQMRAGASFEGGVVAEKEKNAALSTPVAA